MAYEFHRMIHLEPSRGRVDLQGGTLTLMGETSVLVEFGGIRLLVNPSMGRGTTQDRTWVAPAEEVGLRSSAPKGPTTIPALDAVVQLELPDEHFDAVADLHLDKSVPVVTFPDAVEPLESRSFDRVHMLDTWQWIALRKGDASITLTALPVGDGDNDDSDPPAMGCMLELRARPDQTPYRMYFSGPARLTPQVEEIAFRYPRIDLGVVTLMSRMMHGVMLAIDVGAGLELTRTIPTDRVIPVHRLNHIFDWSRRDFERSMARHGDQDSTLSLEFGQPFWFEVAGGANERPPASPGLPFSPAASSPDILTTAARAR